jgi:hypothetical protein
MPIVIKNYNYIQTCLSFVSFAVVSGCRKTTKLVESLLFYAHNLFTEQDCIYICRCHHLERQPLLFSRLQYFKNT